MQANRSSVGKGDALEVQIHDLLLSEIEADRFFAKKSCCKVFRKKGYYSKDRGTDIVFDVSVEVYLPGAADYSLLILIECKNYSTAVPVDDAEEFFAKVQQVAAANVKGVLASTSSFQSGARSFAKSKGIGLIRYFNRSDFKWELKRSPSASASTATLDESYEVDSGLSNNEYRSNVFDLYIQTPSRSTHSLWDFLEDTANDSDIPLASIRRFSNSRSKLTSQIPYIEKDEIESRAIEILNEVAYPGGEVDFSAITSLEKSRSGLTVELDFFPSETDRQSKILGRIHFDLSLIRVYRQETTNLGRDRFTLAHELGHHLLGHGNFLVKDACDEEDFEIRTRTNFTSGDVKRVEFQANYFAASLLLPRSHFLSEFRSLSKQLEIPDKGFGPLYVDNQPCNIHTYEMVTGQLMRKFGASRTAVRIRLESLGLLRDMRNSSNFKTIGDTLGSI